MSISEREQLTQLRRKLKKQGQVLKTTNSPIFPLEVWTTGKPGAGTIVFTCLESLWKYADSLEK